MDNILDMQDFIAAAEGDAEHVLGKFLYFSLANLLVDKEDLSELCDSMGIPYSAGNRLSTTDAFRSATGDIRVRVPVTEYAKSKCSSLPMPMSPVPLAAANVSTAKHFRCATRD